MFNLDEDPAEKFNLAQNNPVELAELTQQILDWKSRYDAGGEMEDRSKEDILRLKALGYSD